VGARPAVIEENHLETYQFRLAKDANALEPGEYTSDEIDAILRQWDPNEVRHWRPWAVFILATHAGQRARAILHLKWSDSVLHPTHCAMVADA
jgi:hypothetical protein